MKILANACLLLILLSPVPSLPNSLLCRGCGGYDCKKQHFAYCHKIKETACYAKVISFPMSGVQHHLSIYHKAGCMPLADCHPYIQTATFPNGSFIYIERQCCTKDLCNKPITVPKENDLELNGMHCPACLITGRAAKEPCSSVTTVNCHGHENECIQYVGLLKTNRSSYRLSVRGCATKKMCAMASGNHTEIAELINPKNTTNVECDTASYDD